MRKVGLGDQRKDFCDIMDEVHRDLNMGATNAQKGKILLMAIAWHESNCFKSRLQGDMDGDGTADGGGSGGPAYGLFQMEPATFKDLWEHLPKGCKDELVATSGQGALKLTADAIDAEMKAIKDNKWPDKSVVCANLRGEDKFAAVAARCELKRDSAALPPSFDNPRVEAPDPTVPSSVGEYEMFLQNLADEWFRLWKKKAGKGQTEGGLKKDFIAKARLLFC